MKRADIAADRGAHLHSLQPLAVRISDACRMTGIGRSKLYELIKAGDIATVKVGTITLVPVAALEAFVARLR